MFAGCEKEGVGRQCLTTRKMDAVPIGASHGDAPADFRAGPRSCGEQRCIERASRQTRRAPWQRRLGK